MPWKEPGEKPREPRGREPWGPGQGSPGPDLDAWLRKFRRGLGPFGRGPLGLAALIFVLIVLWFVIGGWTSIGAQQVGVVLRLGRFERVLQPGLHLRLPMPIDRIRKIDTGRVRTVSDGARLLTSDGQLVLVDYDVHYRITDVRRFLFGTRDAEQVVRDAATAAARAAAGSHKLQCLIDDLDFPCASGRIDGNKLAAEILAQLQAPGMGDAIGVAVTDVAVQDIGVPSDVKQAFAAISAARDNATTAQAAARAEAASSKLKAKEQAASIKTAAEASSRQAVADANTAVARFDQILPQYQAAPQVTRHRLWLDTMRDVLTKNRVVVNTGSGNVIVQFPLQHPSAASSAGSAPPASAQPAASASVAQPATSGPGVNGVD